MKMSIGKVYPCELCKKTFSRNGDLTRHKAIHSGEKNHVCNICGMRFAQYSGLKTHRNTHTGEKPHECTYCSKAFGDPSSCTRHEKEKHCGKPFQCHLCGSSIVRRSSFAGHLRNKHPHIRHLVTKEFLDAIEGPRLRPRNKRRSRTRGTTIHLTSDPRGLTKVVTDMTELYGRGPLRHTATVDDEIMAFAPPKFAPVVEMGVGEVEKIGVVDNKTELEDAKRNADALWLAFEVPDVGTSYTDHASVSYQPAPQYTQSPTAYQQGLDAFNYNYGLPTYGGPPQYDVVNTDGSTGDYDARSASSSPVPVTPTDVKSPPAYVEPSKINSYEYSMCGTEEQPGTQYAAPPLYSYFSEQQQGLPYLGL